MLYIISASEKIIRTFYIFGQQIIEIIKNFLTSCI